MVRRTEAKISALVLSAAVLVLSLVNVNADMVGIAREGAPIARFIYPFFHANIFHAMLNAWCLLTMIFMYDMRLWHMVVAYVISISVPSVFLSTTPTVGLSGVCFSMMGILTFIVMRKWFFFLWCAAAIGIGFLLSPIVSARLHFYCYVAGLLIGFLNYPCIWRK